MRAAPRRMGPVLLWSPGHPHHVGGWQKNERAPAAGALVGLRSQCYRLRLQEPDSELEALRGSRPPELPAGKRGGWHRDSVYPRFRLTSFAPRAVNFVRNSTPSNPTNSAAMSVAGSLRTPATKLLARCRPVTWPSVERQRRLPRSSMRRARWGSSLDRKSTRL